MCQVNPKNKKFIVVKHSKKLLYLQLQKALYGCVQSALLWYILTFQTRKVVGLKLNCTDREFSRQCVEDAMYANEHNQTSGQLSDNKSDINGGTMKYGGDAR